MYILNLDFFSDSCNRFTLQCIFFHLILISHFGSIFTQNISGKKEKKKKLLQGEIQTGLIRHQGCIICFIHVRQSHLSLTHL